ncbi:MAG TPA: hypothetical protein VM577_09325 [Anaerovoracaceae bacterium]|nr:hypothetical protein [Anaerovoracaceae bacterium]
MEQKHKIHIKEHRAQIEADISSYIDKKVKANEHISISEIAKAVDMTRQNLSAYYIRPFKSQIDEHNANRKKVAIQRQIDSFQEEGKDINVIDLASASGISKRYVQNEFSKEIRKLKTRKVHHVTALIDELKKLDPRPNQQQVKSILARAFKLKHNTINLSYGYLLADFEDSVSFRKRYFIEELLSIVTALIKQGIPPTLLSIETIQRIIGTTSSTASLLSRRNELLQAINEHFGTEFESFLDIRKHAVVLTDLEGQVRLTMSYSKP